MIVYISAETGEVKEVNKKGLYLIINDLKI
jgi:hypothetical protein